METDNDLLQGKGTSDPHISMTRVGFAPFCVETVVLPASVLGVVGMCLVI